MNRKLAGYTSRFILVHAVVYWIIGGLFYQISGYEEALDTMEVFELYRPLENIVMVAAVFFGQIIRGAVLALLVYPFHRVFIEKRHGWLLLFGLLFGLMVLGSPVFIREFLASAAEIDTIAGFIESCKIGVPEIIAQTLVFSILFFAWERKRRRPMKAK